jgi:hypothetical protein
VGLRSVVMFASFDPSWIEHVVVQSATRSTVYHWLHGHAWAYPVVAGLVLLIWIRGRRRKNRRTGSSRRGGNGGGGTTVPENVTVLARPTTAKGKGQWVWQEDSQHTSAD